MKTSWCLSKSIPLLFALGCLIRCDFTFAAGCITPGYVSAGTFTAGSNSVFVAVSDVNGDGKSDLVVANQFSDNVSVLLGNGNGTFQPATNYPAGTGPSSLLVRDLNADGKLDLVVTDSGSSTIWVLLGNGDGTFQTAVSYDATDTSQSVAAGDFNGDGKLDLAVVNRGLGTVSVLFGNGNGTFQTPNIYSVGTDPLSVAVGDFNNDGKLDLAVANASLFDETSTTDISVLLGNANGTFQVAINYTAGTSPRSVVVGDFNGDGKPDLAVANYGAFNSSNVFINGSVSVLIGNGNGSFQSPVDYSAGEGPLSLALTNLNADGRSDLVVANDRSGSVSVLFGNSNGTFQPAASYGAGTNPKWVAVGEFNGDRESDLVVANSGGVSVLLNTGTQLALLRSNNTVIISWPFPSTDFILESASSLNPTNWMPAAEVPANNNGCWEVIVPADQGERYFRLRKP